MKVYQAISNVMLALSKQGIGKDKTNLQQNYKFRGIDDIYNALATILAKEGLCILPRVLRRQVTERTSAKGGALFYVVCDVEFDLVCAEDGSKHTITVIGEAMDSGDKATNKAMSAAFKYACLQAFCIPTEGDNDADATTHEVSAGLTDSQMADWMAALETAESADLPGIAANIASIPMSVSQKGKLRAAYSVRVNQLKGK